MKRNIEEKYGDVSGEKWAVQQAWDKQGSFLQVQARVQLELRSMVKQYDELFRGELDALSEKIRNGVISKADRNIKHEEIIVDGLLNRFTKAGKLVEINGQGK